jgi:hypothetical protein
MTELNPTSLIPTSRPTLPTPSRPSMIRRPNKISLLAPAFRLVYEILQKEPLHFQDLLKQSLALHNTQTQSNVVDENTNASSSSKSVVGGGKGKGKGGNRRKNDLFAGLLDTEKQKEEVRAIRAIKRNAPVLPEGHPFISAKSVLPHPLFFD